MKISIKRLTKRLLPLCISLAALMTGTHALAQFPAGRLIVVQDGNGTSALPYYEKSGLTAEPEPSISPFAQAQPSAMVQPVSEANMLPVVSQRVTPGNVISRKIHAPGLTPFFIIGDDALSRQWLQERYPVLKKLGVSGLVVNVQTLDALQSLRQRAPGLTLSAVPGDDLAYRLKLEHYPALVTSTGIEQ